jgi:GntR family transcriptional regulator, vanillate catabolism transcriptional regulator
MYTVVDMKCDLGSIFGLFALVMYTILQMNPSPPLEAPIAAETDASASQALKALLRLREMILSGELKGSERIVELVVVKRLGVSRTPIRAALMKLEQEGLLDLLPTGGYAVRVFSERDVSDTIELRGQLEGLLARLAAERSAQPALIDQARNCLGHIDAILTRPFLDDDAFGKYVAHNQQFHGLIKTMANAPVIARELDHVCRLPFASPSAFVVAQANSPEARDMLIVAQDQHKQVLDAIERREGGRAEAIMKEHSRLAQRNLHRSIRNPQPAFLPGLSLIR